ncbi:MAG: FHA domain-containing protein [Myxococcota bacterium]|jgi:tetratricopeptide (TPR) repeat protein|nr:FHA domain-containing protein [Myxococcota bacterium]
MSWFRSLFNSQLKRAEKLLAAGELEGAAKTFAAAGELERSFELRLQLARAQTELPRRSTLLEALLADATAHSLPEYAEQAQRSLLDTLLGELNKRSYFDRQDKQHAERAAELHEALGEFEKAGELYEKIGFSQKASDAYVRAGQVDKLDALHFDQNLEAQSRDRLREALRAFEWGKQSGAFLDAAEALEEALRVAPNALQVLELQRAFMARMPQAARLHLHTAEGERVLLIGSEEASLGRSKEAEICIAGLGMSRRHIRFYRQDGHWHLENTSTRVLRLNGDVIPERCAIPDEARLELSEAIAVRLRIAEDALVISAEAMAQHFVLGLRFAGPPLGFSVRMERAYWHLEAGHELDDEAVHAPTLIRLGSTISRAGGLLARSLAKDELSWD